MNAPIRLPIRVLIKGASTVVWTSWMGGPRTDFAYPRVVECELLAAGRPAEVRAVGMPSEKLTHALHGWERDVLGFSPDVVVLHYGHFEAIHLFAPRWLERHAHSQRSRPGAVRQFYRRWLLRPVWRLVGKVQLRLDIPLLDVVGRRRARRLAGDLRRLIERVSQVGSPLVIVMEVLPPGRKWAHWFPGMTRRVQLINAHVESMVTDLEDARVRYFRLSDVVARHLAGADPIPDGAHFSPLMHRAVGAELASIIAEWAADQPHLR